MTLIMAYELESNIMRHKTQHLGIMYELESKIMRHEIHYSNSELSDISSSASLSRKFACYIVKGPWSPGETVIATDAHESFTYATEVLHGRFLAGELAIRTNPMQAALYAIFILHHRWLEAEPVIGQCGESCKFYIQRLGLKDQELSEPIIMGLLKGTK